MVFVNTKNNEVNPFKFIERMCFGCRGTMAERTENARLQAEADKASAILEIRKEMRERRILAAIQGRRNANAFLSELEARIEADPNFTQQTKI